MKQLYLFVFLTISSLLYSQNVKIQGKVSDESGSALPGVVIKSGNNSVTTDFDGSYTIATGGRGSQLLFEFLGYQTRTITLDDRVKLDVVLSDRLSKIEEVVIIGYGVQKRSNVTGSIAKIDSKKIENAPVQRLDQALQGKIAGVQIINTSSESGSEPRINIRGISSINAASGPLIVVDGQPIADGFSSINSADVESVEVLKDAASAAIYGSRGAGGVIMITTKSGKADKPKFIFKNTVGFKSPYKKFNNLSTTEYFNLLLKERDLRANDQEYTTANSLFYTNQLPGNQISQYYIENVLLKGNGVDYQDEVLRNGYFQDSQLNVSGGTKDIKYYASFAYQNDEGMLIQNNNERINLRAKIDANLSKKLKLSVNLNPSNVKTEFPGANYTDFYRFASFLPKYHTEETVKFIKSINPASDVFVGELAESRDFLAGSTINPNPYVITLPTGEILSSNSAPFATANPNPWNSIVNREQNQSQFRFQGSTALSYEIGKALTFKNTASVYYRDTNRLNFTASNVESDNSPSQGVFINGKFFDFLTENTLNYKKVLKSHSFDVLGGYTFQSTENNNSQITANGFIDESIINIASATVIEPANTFSQAEKIYMQSFLGRLNYAYKDKYLLSLSYRADESSLFRKGKRWGFFPAASVGWVVSKENFLKNVSAINRLSFRGSYGLSGNNRIPTNSYFDSLSTSSYVTGNGTGSVFNGLASLSNVSFNQDITWERTAQANIAMDLAMFSNRLNLTVDVFRSKTEKLLLEEPALSFTGVNRYLTNIGSLQNEGLEIEFSSKNVVTPKFRWETSINFSIVNNKLLSLGNTNLFRSIGERNEIYQNRVGSPLVEYYGFKTDGVWTSQAEINTAVANGLIVEGVQGYLTPGGLKIADVNKDGKISLDDRTVLGNPYADFTYGITNSFNYKNFDLSFTVQGSQGGELINGDQNYAEIKQRNVDFIENRWVSPSNPGDGRTPYQNNGVNIMLTDYVVEDASYASLREVSLSYNLTKRNLNKLGISGLRLFLSGQNLYFWMPKSYFGINPESRYKSGPYNTPLIDGYQRGGYPIPKTILMGVEVNF